MTFRPGTGSETEPTGPIGQRSIVLSGRTRKYLKNPSTRYIGQEIAAHEMRHDFQDISHYNPNIPWAQRPEEQDAEAFAHGVMQRVKKDHRQQMKRQAIKKRLP